MSQSQQLIGAFFFLSYVAAGELFHDGWVFVFSVVTGAIQFFLINRKPYKELPVFVVYLCSLVFVLFQLGRKF